MTPDLYRQLLAKHGFAQVIPTAQQMGLARAIFAHGQASGAAESELDRMRLTRIEAAALNYVAEFNYVANLNLPIRKETLGAYQKLEEALS